MSAETLFNYAMQRIATVRIEGNKFIIDITDRSAESLEKCIYSFLVGDEILRIGSSRGKLKSRLRAWQNDVSNALTGKSFRTPPEEAAIWKSALAKHGTGQFFARSGTEVRTPVGTLNVFLDEESVLIGRHQPRCCNDVKHHARQ